MYEILKTGRASCPRALSRRQVGSRRSKTIARTGHKDWRI
jgi:hypothetical protein